MTDLNILGNRAQRASRRLAVLRAPEKNRALIAMAEAVQAAQESDFLRTVLPEELSHRYYEEELKRCAALKNAADPAEYERIHYFNAI